LPVDAETAAESLLDACTAAAARGLPSRSDSGLGLLLSGGLDSAAAGAFIRRARADDRPLALTARFPSYPQLDETRLAQLSARHLDLPVATLRVDAGSAAKSSLAYLDTWGVPSVSPNLFFQLPLLALARERGVGAVADGQGGDELFGHSVLLIGDRLRQFDVRAAYALAVNYPGTAGRRRRAARVLAYAGRRSIMPGRTEWLRRRVHGEGPSWLRPASRRIVARMSDWEPGAGDGPLWWREVVNDAIVQRECMEVHDFLRRKEQMGKVVGVHPFLDDVDLIEHVLTLPPEHAFDSRLDRPLLRRALRGLVPEDVRTRAQKARFDPLFVASLEADLEPIASLVGAPDAEVTAYVSPDIVRRDVLSVPPAGRDTRWAWAVWRLYTVECWLRAERDAAFVSDALSRFTFADTRIHVD
jgi:asparagine synthase (glutamine-hydrolysing)